MTTPINTGAAENDGTGDTIRDAFIQVNANTAELEAGIASTAAEVATARGPRASLNDRIGVISNFASPNVGGVISGQYYDAALHGNATGTILGVANRILLHPFYTSVPLTIDRLGVVVSTLIAGALGRCMIYGSDANGWPDALLLNPVDTLDLSTAGLKEHTVSFTFQSGTQYWLAFHGSSTATVRAHPISNMGNLGANGGAGTGYFTSIQRTVTFGTAPSPWAFVAATDRSATLPPAIRFRAA